MVTCCTLGAHKPSSQYWILLPSQFLGSGTLVTGSHVDRRQAGMVVPKVGPEMTFGPVRTVPGTGALRPLTRDGDRLGRNGGYDSFVWRFGLSGSFREYWVEVRGDEGELGFQGFRRCGLESFFAPPCGCWLVRPHRNRISTG